MAKQFIQLIIAFPGTNNTFYWMTFLPPYGPVALGIWCQIERYSSPPLLLTRRVRPTAHWRHANCNKKDLLRSRQIIGHSCHTAHWRHANCNKKGLLRSRQIIIHVAQLTGGTQLNWNKNACTTHANLSKKSQGCTSQGCTFCDIFQKKSSKSTVHRIFFKNYENITLITSITNLLLSCYINVWNKWHITILVPKFMYLW